MVSFQGPLHAYLGMVETPVSGGNDMIVRRVWGRGGLQGGLCSLLQGAVDSRSVLVPLLSSRKTSSLTDFGTG